MEWVVGTRSKVVIVDSWSGRTCYNRNQREGRALVRDGFEGTFHVLGFRLRARFVGL